MRWLLFSLVCGCGAELPVAELAMSLGTDGLQPSDVGSILVLVLEHASCDRALAAPSPLDDPSLQVISHALFAADGTDKHLSLPAGETLVFYVEAYRSADGSGTHVGRGCAEATLTAGKSSGVAITINADPQS